MAQAIKTNISFEELEKYRDEQGFIDLDELNIELTEESREKIGNEYRIKNWMEISGVNTLIKSECKVDDKTNGGIYAELLVEELAKQAGLTCAEYDLVKIKGEYGVLSKTILQSERDDLHTVQSMIGDTTYYEEYPDISDYIEVEQKLYKALKEEEIEKENIKKIIKDFRKQNAFFLMVCSVDKYAENISLINYINPETKQKKVRLAPIYDSECSLMLDMDFETLEEIGKNGIVFEKAVDMLDPKIAVLEGDYASPWKNTLDVLCEDDEIFDFIMDCYDNLDIKEAIRSVEKKIKAPIPNNVKKIATYAFKFRKKEMEKILYPEIGENIFANKYKVVTSNTSIEEEIEEEENAVAKLMEKFGVYGKDETSNDHDER